MHRVPGGVRIEVDSASVRQALEAFLAEPYGPLEAARAAQQHQALPLYLDWVGCFALRPSGELVFFPWEAPSELSPVEELGMAHVARAVGGQRYSTLPGLLPERDPDAVVCTGCGGTGVAPSVESLPADKRDAFVCSCGGLGWLPAALA